MVATVRVGPSLDPSATAAALAALPSAPRFAGLGLCVEAVGSMTVATVTSLEVQVSVDGGVWDVTQSGALELSSVAQDGGPMVRACMCRGEGGVGGAGFGGCASVLRDLCWV